MKFDGIEVFAFGTAVAIGAIAVPAVIQAWRRRRPRPPSSNDTKWKYVGTLDILTIYPLKSGKGIDLQAAYCSERGPVQLVGDDEDKVPLKDRYFLLIRDDNGEQVCGRTFPIILKISIKPENKDCVRFSFPGKWDLIVKIPKEGKRIARVWRMEPIGCLDCGDEAARWMTEVIKGPKTSDDVEQVQIRLGYWPPNNSLRKLTEVGKDVMQFFPDVTNYDTGAYSDFTSYMLMTSSSVDELNQRLQGLTVSHRVFRPNFYVKTDEEPFSDLTWKWVKIGNMIFRYVKGCKRCAMTTFDPETSLKFPNNEPLTTLNRMAEAAVTVPLEEKPMMGIHLGSYDSGIVKVGDPVYVIKN